MILYGTPPNLVLKQMEDEVEKVRYALFRGIKAAAKDIGEEIRRRAPSTAVDGVYIRTSTYTVPASKNSYLLWYAFRRDGGMLVSRGCDFLLTVNASNGHVAYYDCSSGENLTDGKRVRMLAVLTGHFLSRYRKRMGLNGNFDTRKLVALFMIRNETVVGRPEFQNLNANAGQYEDGDALQLADGIAFVRKKELADPSGKPFTFLHFSTFVSKDLLKGNQHELLMDDDEFYFKTKLL